MSTEDEKAGRFAEDAGKALHLKILVVRRS